MDAPDELRQAVTDAINKRPLMRYFDQADAVLSVPGIADALARDAAVAEWVRQGADGGVMQNVMPIHALYPEAGK